MKIKSITDVITNSSTEVYMYALPDSLVRLKNIINSILSIVDNNLTCDDIFEIQFQVNEDAIKDMYEDDHDEGETYEQFKEVCMREYPELAYGLQVVPKTAEYQLVANKINDNINRLFDYGEFYN